jgi:hypothetical protein
MDFVRCRALACLHGGTSVRRRDSGLRRSGRCVLSSDPGFWPRTCAGPLVGFLTLGVLMVTSSI